MNDKYKHRRDSVQINLSSAKSLREILEKTGLSEICDMEYADSLQNEMDIVYSEGEERDRYSKKKYVTMKEENPSGAAFLKNRFDGVEFEVEEDADAIETAVNDYISMGEELGTAYPYGSAVKMIEEYDVEEEFKDEYNEAIRSAVTCFFEDESSNPLALVDILYSSNDEDKEFETKFKDVYWKILKTGEHLESPELMASAYKLSEEAEEVPDSDDVSLKDIKGFSFDGFDVLEYESLRRMKKVLSKDFVEYLGQKRWIEKNLDVEVPGFYELSENYYGRKCYEPVI